MEMVIILLNFSIQEEKGTIVTPFTSEIATRVINEGIPESWKFLLSDDLNKSVSVVDVPAVYKDT